MFFPADNLLNKISRGIKPNGNREFRFKVPSLTRTEAAKKGELKRCQLPDTPTVI